MLLVGKPDQERDSFPNKTRKSLIGDDDESILHLLRRFFAAKGFQVSVAGDGFRAMEQLKSETPSVVLTELKIPCLPGFDWIQWVRNHSKEVPIVIMTAYPHFCPEKK